MAPQGRTVAISRRRCINKQPIEAASVPDALLTLKTASAVAGMSPETLRRREKSDPTFPRLVKLGPRCTRLRAGDLSDWLARQAGGR